MFGRLLLAERTVVLDDDDVTGTELDSVGTNGAKSVGTNGAPRTEGSAAGAGGGGSSNHKLVRSVLSM